MTDLPSKIHTLHLQDLENKNHPSSFDKHESYEIFIFRGVTLENNLAQTSNSSFCYYDNKFFLYQKGEFLEIKEGYKGLYSFLNNKTDESIRVIEHFCSNVDFLEEKLYSKELSTELMEYWFDSKKNLIKIERILNQTSRILTVFMSEHKQGNGIKHIGFKDIKEHLERYHRLCESYLKKLDSIYMFYNTLHSERTNNTLYILTWISAFFLPLNLLVGFFGMNTEGMFLKENPSGTTIVLYSMLLFFIIIGVTIFIKKRRKRKQRLFTTPQPL